MCLEVPRAVDGSPTSQPGPPTAAGPQYPAAGDRRPIPNPGATVSRVIVVGGGIVGTSVAAHLAADADREVTLLEHEEFGGGATADSMAVFTRMRLAPTRLGQRLRDRSWRAYEDMTADGAVGFTRTGSLRVPAPGEGAGSERRDAGTRYETAAADLRGLGVEARVLDGPLDDRGLAVDGPALFVPDDGHLTQQGVVDYYVERAREAGAVAEHGVTVRDVLADGDRVVGVRTDAGTYEADAVVNAAGPSAPVVNAAAGVDLPIRRTRGPIVELAVETENGAEPAAHPRPIPFTLFGDALYLRRSPRGYYVGEYNTDFDPDRDVDPEARGGVGAAFRRRARDRLRTALGLPDAELAVVDEWVGLRTVTPDGRPLVGATERPGFHVATGMNGQGVTLAPAVGESFARAFDGGGADGGPGPTGSEGGNDGGANGRDADESDLLAALSPRRF